MSEISFVRVISCSSEDSGGYASSNLLNSNVASGKWRCKAGEKSASVVLQLDRSAKIGQIDIGNNGSAFVEVLVGKSTNSVNDFSVIVPSSSFMSPAECKMQGGGNTCRVRMFSTDKLTKPICDENWDLLKIVCTQPFNKNVPFGISFVKVYPLLEKPTGTVDETLSKTASNSLSIKSPIPERKIPAIPKLEDKAPTNAKEEKKAQPSSAVQQSSTTPRPSVSVSENKRSVKRSTSPEVDSSAGQKRQKGRDSSQSQGNRPLAGVVFVLSGFQNPERSNLRNKAIELGARYEADWNDKCTHLICAFANTPKFNQVKGSGKIVSKKWIEDCHAKKALLDWHAYDMCSKDSYHANHSKSPTDDSKAASSDSKKAPLGVATVPADNLTDLTDQLPDIFLQRRFYVHPSMDSKVQVNIERLIVTFGGSIMDRVSSATDYVIADDGTDISELEINHPEVVVVRPDWVFACQRKQKLLPHDQFAIASV